MSEEENQQRMIGGDDEAREGNEGPVVAIMGGDGT